MNAIATKPARLDPHLDAVMGCGTINVSAPASVDKFMREEAKRLGCPISTLIVFALRYAIDGWMEAVKTVEPFPPLYEVFSKPAANTVVVKLDGPTNMALESMTQDEPGVTVAGIVASQIALLMKDVVREAALGDNTISDEMIETARDFRR